jgi:hypothetical protein
MVGKFLCDHEKRADTMEALSNERDCADSSVGVNILLVQREKNSEKTRLYVI